jgi:hypothetical protein
MNTTNDYPVLRLVVKDGDHIGVCGTSWAAALTRLAQRLAGLPYSEVTHSAVAIWADGRLFVAEMNKAGNVIKPLSQYKDTRIVVHRAPVAVDAGALAERLGEVLQTHKLYGYGDLLRLGFLRGPALRLGLSKPLSTDSMKDLVCSMFSAWVYRLLGWERALPELCFPAEVSAALGDEVLIYEPWPLDS